MKRLLFGLGLGVPGVASAGVCPIPAQTTLQEALDYTGTGTTPFCTEIELASDWSSNEPAVHIDHDVVIRGLNTQDYVALPPLVVHDQAVVDIEQVTLQSHAASVTPVWVGLSDLGAYLSFCAPESPGLGSPLCVIGGGGCQPDRCGRANRRGLPRGGFGDSGLGSDRVNCGIFRKHPRTGAGVG